MARNGFKLNHRGMDTVLHSRGVENEMEDRAEKVAVYARTLAPVATGAYKASIYADTEDHPSRVVGRAGAHVDYATALEAKVRIFGRAIDAARG